MKKANVVCTTCLGPFHEYSVCYVQKCVLVVGWSDYADNLNINLFKIKIIQKLTFHDNPSDAKNLKSDC